MEITLLQQERWICQNGTCGSEIVVTKPSEIAGAGPPRCRCGSIMKKFYTAPTLRHLDGEEAETLLRDSMRDINPIRTRKPTKR